MELVAAILLAGPLGYHGGNRRRGLVLYLLVWTITFPIQTLVVHSTPDDLYWVVNAVILCAGVGLNTAGSRLRERRIRAAAAASR